MSLDSLHILSVRSPWWWWIFYGPKRLENRPRSSKYVGPVAIQISKFKDYHAIQADHETAKDMFIKGRHEPLELQIPSAFDFEHHPHLGCIIGVVDQTGFTRASNDPFFRGPVALMFENPRLLTTPIPCRGQQMLFHAPRDIRMAVKAQLEPK